LRKRLRLPPWRLPCLSRPVTGADIAINAVESGGDVLFSYSGSIAVHTDSPRTLLCGHSYVTPPQTPRIRAAIPLYRTPERKKAINQTAPNSHQVAAAIRA
jgi:hypothetical protein